MAILYGHLHLGEVRGGGAWELPHDGHPSPRPAIPGGLLSSRARVRFAGRVDHRRVLSVCQGLMGLTVPCGLGAAEAAATGVEGRMSSIFAYPSRTAMQARRTWSSYIMSSAGKSLRIILHSRASWAGGMDASRATFL